MKKASAIIALVLMLATVSSAFAIDLTFGAGRDFSGQTGTVSLTAEGNQTKVVINVNAGPAGATTPQPAHIHVGGCPGVGSVAAPLTAVVGGKSETTVNMPLATFQATQHAINIHKSQAEAGVYTACVNIPLAAAAPPAAAPALPRTGGLPMELILGAGGLIGFAGYLLRRR